MIVFRCVASIFCTFRRGGNESSYEDEEVPVQKLLTLEFEISFRVFVLCAYPVDEPKDANIIWTHMQIDEEFCKAAGIKPYQYVNQFPSEACIVMKHNLADTIQKVLLAHQVHLDVVGLLLR